MEKLILLFINLLGHTFALNVLETHSTLKVGLKQQLMNYQNLMFYWFLGLIDWLCLSEYQIRMYQVVGTPKVNQHSNKDKTLIKMLQESWDENTWKSRSAIFNHTQNISSTPEISQILIVVSTTHLLSKEFNSFIGFCLSAKLWDFGIHNFQYFG